MKITVSNLSTHDPDLLRNVFKKKRHFAQQDMQNLKKLLNLLDVQTIDNLYFDRLITPVHTHIYR